MNKLLLFLILPLTALAQSQEYSTSQRKLNNLVGTVNTADAEHNQTLSFDKEKPFYAEIKAVKTDKKGKSTETRLVFNLGDLNAPSVVYKIQKDVITVIAETKNGQKFIKGFENDSFDGFTHKITFYAGNIDDARSAVAELKKMIPLAEKLDQVYLKLPDTYAGLSAWLKTHIDTQESGDTRYEQSLNTQDLIAEYLCTTHEKGQIKRAEKFVFNWGDLNAKALNIDVKSKQLEVRLGVKNKKKYISYLKSDVPQNNEYELIIPVFDVDKAKSLKSALEKLIPLAEQRLAQSAPRLNDRATALQLLKKADRTLADKSGDIRQEFDAACMASLKISTSGKNGAEERYSFSMADLNDKKLELGVKGSLFVIELSTNNNQKVISYFKNDQKQNYTNSITLTSDNLEDFRYLPEALKKVIADCKASERNRVPGGSLSATMDWLEKQIPRLESDKASVNQSLAISKDCSMKFTEERADAKKSSEMVYEAGLKDLNANAVSYDISGKNIFVILTANGKEKLIKTYKDGTPGNYTNEIRIQVDDVSLARDVAEGFKAVIKGCSGK